MSPKTERLELRADSDFLAKVDEWRRNQPDLPPRAAAIRRLVEKGLEADRVEQKRRR
jgi:hypothetical protein